MFSKELAVFAAGLSTASATIYSGFNYGASTDFATEFALAKSLVGTNGEFTSARLYTTIEEGTTNTPTSAISAAIAGDVTLLLGLWASSGQTTITDEIAALTAAISTYGTSFTNLVAGISVGSEDLYRISTIGIENLAGVGAEPADLVSYIAQVRSAIAGTALASVPVGHVDTWTAWVNGSNDAVISACDFLGMDAYPYFQPADSNAIGSAYDLFFSAYDQTVAASSGKPVWVTETGWPASGPNSGDAVPSTANAGTYWQEVACKLLGTTNTFWYTLNDAGASPSFGVTTGSSTPLYNLSCSASSSSSSSSSTAASSTASVVASGSSTSAAASTTAASSSAAVISNSIVPVTSSAVASQNGSPSISISISAVSSAVSTIAAGSSAVSASASTKAGNSTASAASSASAAASTVVGATLASAAASSQIASASSAFASASSALKSSGTVAVSNAISASGAASASGTALPSGAGPVVLSSSAQASTAAASGTTRASASATKASTTAVASYTGSASTLRSTGGFVAALVAMLAVF